VTGLFLAGYGIARIACEMMREDTDPQIGLGLLTSGQMYSLPMVALGLVLVYRAHASTPGTRALAPAIADPAHPPR
jgi:phosphatidylglycerol:prolipoprotein diacylglycerol transferase